MGTKKDFQAEIYRYNGGTDWTKASQPSPGQIQPQGTTGINLAIAGAAVVNDLLFIGTDDIRTAEVYSYSDL